MVRPFPDKDVVPGSDPKQQCSATPACAAEFKTFMDPLVANLTNPASYQVTVVAD